MHTRSEGDLDNVLDHRLISVSQLALEKKIQVYGDFSILNTDRATGAMLSYRVSKMHGEEGFLPILFSSDLKVLLVKVLGRFWHRG
ncbi:MAG: hypothetical protein CM1200mP16_04760 [Nitrospina sp.]|nr:MAG: hypothetical protein CM1200mP16_04760 [Nitrospina sp.]